MRKVIVSEYVTADGVMEDPGGGEKKGHGGWSFQFWTEESAKFKMDELRASDGLLLGRVTYNGFAAAWPTMQGTGEYGERMNSFPKYVVSTTLQTLEWNNSTLIKGNVAAEIGKLKQQPGQDLLVFGSGKLVEALIAHRLVDEYRLMIHPIVVGGGQRLFRDGIDKHVLKLVNTKSFSSGVVVLSYQTTQDQ